MRSVSTLLIVLISGCAAVVPLPERQDIGGVENDWYRTANARLHARLAVAQPGDSARNVILFIGDGMSLATVTAARILEGQLRGEPGEENLLSFETFAHTGLAKTYNTDSQVPDSAGTASAMLTGVKTRIGMLGLNENAVYGDCASARGNSVPTLLEHAERAGLATGIVTTTRVTHATPASGYAHTPHRGWETNNNQDMGECVDIARQLVEFSIGDGPDVVLGGGRAPFMPQTATDPERPEDRGWRTDGRDLIAEWRERNPTGVYVSNKREFERVNPARAGKLLGLFEPADMQYEADRDDGSGGEPSLAEMVETAITMLGRDEDGFFLLVEGGRIDHAHHEGNAYRALHDTIALSDAVSVARGMTDPRDTLIVVTADHGHVMEIAGYPRRGNPILGKVVATSAGADGAYARDALGLPYTTIVYGNGPGHIAASDVQAEGAKSMPHRLSAYEAATRGRPDLSQVDTTDANYLQEAAVPMRSETHSGTDVPVYADGPGARLIAGVNEQNYLFHVMAHALFGSDR